MPVRLDVVAQFRLRQRDAPSYHSQLSLLFNQFVGLNEMLTVDRPHRLHRIIPEPIFDIDIFSFCPEADLSS